MTLISIGVSLGKNIADLYLCVTGQNIADLYWCVTEQKHCLPLLVCYGAETLLTSIGVLRSRNIADLYWCVTEQKHC